MQKKIIAFIIFLMGAGLFFLGMLQDDFSCDKSKNICSLRSRIPAINLTIDNLFFKFSEFKDVECVKRTQAARGGGRRAYYELTLITGDNSYVLESCPNLKICRRHSDLLLDYKYLSRYSQFHYKSSVGVSNVMGVILGVVLIIFGAKMFFDKSEPLVDEEVE